MDISTAQSIKLAIVSATGLSKDALHIYVGMAVYLTLIVGIRRFRPYLGWLVVLIIACAGEWVDRLDDIGSFGYWRYVMAASPVLSFRVKPELASELDQLAHATDRDRQYHLQRALSRYVADES